SRFLQDRVGKNHLARNQILADTEMLEGTLGLRPPELVGRDVHFAEAVHLLANVVHLASPHSKIRRLHPANRISDCNRWRRSGLSGKNVRCKFAWARLPASRTSISQCLHETMRSF